MHPEAMIATFKSLKLFGMTQAIDDLAEQGSPAWHSAESVLDALLDIRNLPPVEARTYLAQFLFEGDDVFKPVSVLSGGERTRLAFARLLLEEPNVLVLDEPTTHLDIASREALEQVLLQFEGTQLFVSHDRALISMLADQLLIVEDGAVTLFEDKFEEWAKTREESAVKVMTRTKPKGRSKGSPTPPAPPNGVVKPNPVDHENVIADLELRLTRLGRALQKASEDQDYGKATKLGERFELVQQELDAAWQAWGG